MNPGQIAVDWWHSLQPRDRRPGDRAALARLRRAARVMEGAAEPAAIQLCRRLGMGWRGLERAALVAAVLAHVRDDDPARPVARQIGASRDQPAKVSPLRFRRLLQAVTPDEQLIAFRRVVAQADRKVNIADLADSLLNWSDARRLRWTYAYYDAPAPEDIAA